MLNDVKDFCCLELKCSVMFFFNIEFSSKMFEFICDPLHGLASLFSCECHRKYARGEIP